jgi:hypothetical protein
MSHGLPPVLRQATFTLSLATFGCIVATLRKNRLTRKNVRRAKARFLVEDKPTWQLSLQPAAIGAVVEATKQPKPLM